MFDIQFLTIQDVLIIHEKMLQIGGGSSGLRDSELLYSALGRAQAMYGGEYLYTSIWDMAGALLQSLVKNHPFVDGNKRSAFFSTLKFLNMNNHNFEFAEDEIEDFCVDVDTKGLSVEDIALWFKSHVV